MSDQIGRHDATGPLARDADGRVDPDGYVRSALQGREMLLLHGFMAAAYGVVLLLRGFGSPGGFVVLGILLALDVAVVCVIRGSQWLAERTRRRAGHPPSWSAGLFVLQARTQGFDIPRAVRNDSRLPGRLADRGDHWAWTSGRRGQKRAVQPINLAPGWIPRITERVGSHGIATFDTSSESDPRLDFWIGRRRDLQRHLAT